MQKVWLEHLEGFPFVERRHAGGVERLRAFVVLLGMRCFTLRDLMTARLVAECSLYQEVHRFQSDITMGHRVHHVL